MSQPTNVIAQHYGRQQRTAAVILDALAADGHDLDALAPDVLSGADEFHLGGRLATLAVLEAVRPAAPRTVLDIGCGIGGPARTIDVERDDDVIGIDLTPSFVEAATELTERVGLADRVTFGLGDALALDADDDTVDLATLFHVGMNIADKRTLFAELARVVRPGGQVLVYDIMRVADGDLTLPLPWASSDGHQHLAAPTDYIEAMSSAELEPGVPVDRRDVVMDAIGRAASAPPPVDLSHLMGPDFATMFANLRAAMLAGVVLPMQIVATAPA